jgi:protein-S-isoprenylcysteine O-methyltransferase Ste14
LGSVTLHPIMVSVARGLTSGGRLQRLRRGSVLVVRRHVTMTLPSTLSVLGLIWFASELCLMTRRSGPGTTSKDRGSLRVILFVNMASIGLGIMAAHHFRACVLPARSLFYVIGICVFVLGFVLRFYSIFYLGRFFTINVAIATDHHLIDSGP